MFVTFLGEDDDLISYACPNPVGGGEWDLGFLNTEIRGSIEYPNDRKPVDLEIKKSGTTFKVYLDSKLVMSMNSDKFNSFSGFRIKLKCLDGFRERYIRAHFIEKIVISYL